MIISRNLFWIFVSYISFLNLSYGQNYIFTTAGDNFLHAKDCSDALLNIKILSQNWNEIPEQRNAIQSAFKICLGHYIRMKTISPEGFEKQAVDYFKVIFDDLEISNKVFEVKDLTGINSYRYNLVATVPANQTNQFDWAHKSSTKSIILLNHMDVVGTHPDQWQAPNLDFSGEVHPDDKGDLYIWGRGALDMKGIGIVQLFNMWLAKKLNLPMKRDLHFLAVADEEQSASGAIGALQKMQAGEELHNLSNANLVLNEGGGGAMGLPSAGNNLFLVAAEEKGGAWLNIEHKDPIKLLENLYKSKILQINQYIEKNAQKITGHGCKLVEANTPDAKVNVIASKIDVKFQCRPGFQGASLFKSVFEKDFKTIVAKTKQTDDILSMELTSGSSSHGSMGLNESLMTAFVVGLYHFDILKLKKNKYLPRYFRYLKSEATTELITELGKTNRLIRYINALRFIPFINRLLLKQLEGEFGVDGWFKTTCQFSAFDFKKDARALVDCRLLHTAKIGQQNQAESFIKELNQKIQDPDNQITLIDGWDFSSSSPRSEDFKILQKSLTSFSKVGEKVLVVPFLFPAGSDSSWFRNPWTAGSHIKPILSFGFFPVYLTPELLGAMHGANERFPVAQITPTIHRYQFTLANLLKANGQVESKHMGLSPMDEMNAFEVQEYERQKTLIP